ncbi:helix-turn-helix transcriptional regulator [Rheinheimera faecalis]|uniref:helix-turn-helix transcriptional regulator n=1 Tax=Rheinheimera faecalis TaxID=2901141 RepID=UPI001E5622BF|nr:helix-turn-helix transcriptional regulator [Rheinheimera faecalis]
MDMQINIELVKSHRNKRAWSQTQLAEVSGLSLRTIQRIEKTGSASLESIKSIASVFEIEAQSLQTTPDSPVKNIKVKLSALLGVVSITLFSFFVVTATAQPVMLDLQLKSSGETIADVQVLNEENFESEILVSNKVRVLLTSVIETNDTIRVFTKIYDLSSGQEVLIGAPSMVTKHQEKAEIHFGDFELLLTPNL